MTKSAVQKHSARRGHPGRSSFTGIRLGAVAGFEISLDYSWFVIFFLLLVSFSGGVFPAGLPGLEHTQYLLMGMVGTVLFFASLLFHELAHAFVARRHGIEVEGITLFIFGGVARTSREPTSPGDEFLIAGVGPLASFVLSLFFYGIAVSAGIFGWGQIVALVAGYLGLLNLVLAIFNLVPGFPLDGGRLLRATIWKGTGSFRGATRVATLVGRIFGWVVMVLGIFNFLWNRDLIGGLWLVFIGWFLEHSARASYDQVLLQEMMSPLTAREAMSPEPETVAPDLPVDDLVHDYFLRRPYNSFPVTEDGIVLGIVTLGQVKHLSKEEWKENRVSDVMSPLHETVLVDPDTPMTVVLERMRVTASGRVLVAREWELLGIISSADIARWLDRVSLID
jgi:Zn-dependent protease/CBS domain-containing protein